MSKSVALVLSSGGARGVAHIGVIEALLESGYEITSISGSSMGAVVGAVYAAGKLKEYKEWVCNFDKVDVFKLMDFTLSTQGFVRGDRVFNEMKKFIPDCNIEDLSIPFAAVATDIVNRREVVFTSGSVFGALRASAAIPSVMKPAVINDIELVDGGVLNPIPINYVDRRDDDILVVSDVNAAIPCSVKNRQLDQKGRFSPLVEKWNSFFPKVTNKQKRLSYFDLIAKSVDLMQDRISEYILAQTKPEIVVRISRETCGTFEFYRSSELIDCGKEEFFKSLEHALQGVESDAG
ncbi:patatin-like phospholipase family protein [Fulvivirga sediminis]|uniref:Patatin-like phospholipase family protein n=1 Tax=Fulvivirga sediminis TaxID=2803949 RepID=A0A937FCF1_9BACT|nr:patatin-like phospholipase family protein [Fulvivirga sediminis]MBL3657873.1 patatin-like phospholipase family protein [Fulvivirga sediminis]